MTFVVLLGYIGARGFGMGHLEEVGMGYREHLGLAWLNSLRLLVASVALFVHGCFPFLFVHVASDILKRVSFPSSKRQENER
jgi:hypothetical protein